MSNTNNLIKSIDVDFNNKIINIDFNQNLFSDSNLLTFLKIDNFKIIIKNNEEIKELAYPDLIFKNNDNYTIIFNLKHKVEKNNTLHIELIDVYNKNGFLVNQIQLNNFIQIKESYHMNNNLYSIQNTQNKEIDIKPKINLLSNVSLINKNHNYSIHDYLREYEQEKNKIKNNKSIKNINKMGTCYANMTIIQSNPGLAYKLNLIKYHAYVASLYPKFYGTTPKKYPPEYYMSSYDRILKPTQEVKPLT